MRDLNNDWMEKRDQVRRLKAERALQLLSEHIAKIRYVKDWSQMVGCTESTLNRLSKRYFEANSKQVLKEVRFKKIRECIEENPDMTSFAVARSCGLHNEQGLFKFLKRHFDTTYSEIKYEVLLRELSKQNSRQKLDNLVINGNGKTNIFSS